jgi:hypothetical protein
MQQGQGAKMTASRDRAKRELRSVRNEKKAAGGPQEVCADRAEYAAGEAP